MAIDSLQNRIRKLKTALAVDLSAIPGNIPPVLAAQYDDPLQAYEAFGKELLNGLKGVVPAVRFGFAAFSLLGVQGLGVLSGLLRKAASLGFYVLLDAPELLSAPMAELCAASVWGADALYPCDGLVISSYCGSDIIKPFLPYCSEQKKDLFVCVRTANKSAAELQDLLTGTRLVHAAAADFVNRFGDDTMGKFGYTRVGIMASATSAESLKNLRTKYPRLFILADGIDAVGANAKNCAAAFDPFGRGALVCAGTSVVSAWKKQEDTETDYAAAAAADVARLQKNLKRYITVM